MDTYVVGQRAGQCLSHHVGAGCCAEATMKATLLQPSSAPAAMGRPTKGRAFEQLLASWGLREVETLDSVAPAGSCQFASVGEQLFHRPCAHKFRYDQLLRQAALAEIRRRAADFQPYLIAARVRTRRQERVGGDAIDMEEYLARMADESCDGDHITLQALSDVTGATINVVKWAPRGGHTGAAVVMPPVQPHPDSSSRRGTSTLTAASGHHLWLTLRGESHFRSLHRAAAAGAQALASAAPSDTAAAGAGAGAGAPASVVAPGVATRSRSRREARRSH